MISCVLPIENEGVVFGKIKKMIPGAGLYAGKLTTVEICGISDGHETNERYFIRFVDKEYGLKLSRRVSKMKIGDCLSARVIFDVGKPNFCDAVNLKTNGIYRVGEREYIICGYMDNIVECNKNYMLFYMSEKTYRNDSNHTEWYKCYFKKPDEKLRRVISGNYAVVYTNNIFLKNEDKEAKQLECHCSLIWRIKTDN